jgi:AcrR family transcriptional regulator
MSTVDDNKSPRRRRTSSTDMRARVLTAAGRAFSRAGYDAVGIREIASAADTDPAIIIRLFGSKAELFAELAKHVFRDEEVFQGPLKSLGQRLAEHLMQPLPPSADDNEIDHFQLMLRSAASLTAAPILSAALHNALVEPLGDRIGKIDGNSRAALIIAQVLGFSTLRFALGSPAIETADSAVFEKRLAKAIQTCLSD